MSQRTRYRGRFIRITEEKIKGQVYERAIFKNTVTVFPVTDEGTIIFIRELRPHERPRFRWKPVTGFLEKGQSVAENARRELEEEIGLSPKSVKPYFRTTTTGTINITQHFVIARKLAPFKRPNPDGEETILGVRALGLSEIRRRTLDGEFAQGILGYVLLRLCGEVREGKLKL